MPLSYGVLESNHRPKHGKEIPMRRILAIIVLLTLVAVGCSVAAAQEEPPAPTFLDCSEFDYAVVLIPLCQAVRDSYETRIAALEAELVSTVSSDASPGAVSCITRTISYNEVRKKDDHSVRRLYLGYGSERTCSDGSSHVIIESDTAKGCIDTYHSTEGDYLAGWQDHIADHDTMIATLAANDITHTCTIGSGSVSDSTSRHHAYMCNSSGRCHLYHPDRHGVITTGIGEHQ